jgi:serpin B
MRVLSLLMSVVLALSLAAVGCGGGGGPAAGQVLASDEERITAPDADDADVALQSAANRAFALDLYQFLAAEQGDLFFSPYSISLALAMTWAGARGQTEQQMAEALHFELGQDALHPVFNYLDLELNSRGQGAAGTEGRPFRLHVVNQTWGQLDYTFLEPYLDVLAQHYGAAMRLLDFATAPDECRRTINAWVAEQTEDLIPERAIDEMTRLVLTNAIYFNAGWDEEFPPEATHDGAFERLDGSSVTVPMMSQTHDFPFYLGDGFRAVELPYDGGELSMVLLRPDADFSNFEANLTVEQLDAVLAGLQTDMVTVRMPRWTYDGDTISLKDALCALGMPVAFSNEADFSGMDGRRFLFISDVVHQAFISVDEAGTEAGAATAVIMSGMGEPPDEINLDRPFIYLIRDIQTGTILFMGRVLDPS